VATRIKKGSYKWKQVSKDKASISHTGSKKPWARENIIKLMTTGKIKKFNTRPELYMKSILNFWNIDYEFQKIIKGVICDFYIPSKKAIIHVDGEYWHDYPNGTEKDKIQDKRLIEAGYRVKRYWAKPIEKGVATVLVKYFIDQLKPVC